jgi:hypothetical protein
MVAGNKTAADRVALTLGWIVTLIGCVVIAGALTALYFLLVEGVPPGQPALFDAVVPPMRGAVLHLANGVVLTIAPFILRWAIRCWRASRSLRSP